MDRVVDKFVTVQAGDAFRLLRYGPLVKGGRKRVITPELASRFRLPHFKPPLKLGSHKDETAAGGHIVALEVRDDGLWAVPEYNEEGAAAVRRGAFRYQSPEIVWEGGFEDPETGKVIEAPLIVGAALLHTPHLGEAAALYSTEEISMYENDEQVSVGLLEKLMAILRGPQATVELAAEPVAVETEAAAPAIAPDEYAAVVAQRDELAAELEAMKVQKERAARVELFEGELAETPLSADGELHELLAGLGDDVAQALLKRLKALSAQSKVAELTADVGASENPAGSPAEMLQAAIAARRAETKDDYIAALNYVRQTQPELVHSVYG